LHTMDAGSAESNSIVSSVSLISIHGTAHTSYDMKNYFIFSGLMSDLRLFSCYCVSDLLAKLLSDIEQQKLILAHTSGIDTDGNLQENDA
ncbi:MAG: hypothetical protein ACRC1W_11110, partial [Shewanella sp.]